MPPDPRRLGLSVAPAVLVFGVLGWFAGSARPLFGSPWPSRLIVWALAALAAFVVYRLLEARGSAPPSRPAGDPVRDLFSRAKEKLTAAGYKRREIFGKVPAVLILGPGGSAKTSLVLQSAAGSEHLAGNVGDDALRVPHTEVANIWYYEGHVLVESSGKLVVEPEGWSSLVRSLRPARGLSNLLGKPQAPRIAVVCFSCEELVNPGPGDAHLAAARTLRSRLIEFSEAMGTRVPVYVVFTKADALPHFESFASPMSEGEASDVLGATLPPLAEGSLGEYTTTQTRRLGEAFERMVGSLSRLCLDLLPRVESGAPASEVYEFPREFSKASTRAVQFLVELCRPGQLTRVSPFLRGSYFVGVRPVLESGAAEDAPRARSARSETGGAGATQLLDARAFQEALAGDSTPSPKARRMPQWVFTRQLFERVLLADEAALGMARGGVGLQAFRRAALAVLLAGVVLGGLVVVGSALRDRALQGRVAEALDAAAPLETASPSALTEDQLTRLDQLRAATAELSDHENGRRPLRSILGLYTGDVLYPRAREVYFDLVRTLLLQPSRTDIVRTLSELPSTPTLDQYDRVYDALKLEVELTEAFAFADGEFFRTRLTDHWEASLGGPQPTIQEMVADQFQFLGDQLRYGSPWGDSPDLEYRQRVARTRQFLMDHTNDSSFLASVVAQANRLPGVRFAEAEPAAASLVTSDVEVPGAFTRPGWDTVQAAIADPASFLTRDEHVVGEGFFAGTDARALGASALSLYRQEYARTWIEFLEEARLTPFQFGRAQAIEQLASNQSALFRLLNVAARHTRVGDPVIDSAFVPLHQVVAADSVATLWSEQAQPYMQALGSLAGAFSQLADAPEQSAEAVRSSSTEVENAVRQISQMFPAGPARAVAVGNAVTSLLRAPPANARGVAGQAGRVALNQDWRAVCNNGQPPFNRFPFTAGAADANIEDVNAFLHPESGRLWAFHTDVAATANTNRAYASFFRQAQEIRDALYAAGGESPVMVFSFQGLASDATASIVLNVDGQEYVNDRNDANEHIVRWEASVNGRVTVTANGDTENALSYTGPWALFRLYDAAAWVPSGDRHELSWTHPNGLTTTALVSLSEVARPGYLASFRCPQGIAGE